MPNAAFMQGGSLTFAGGSTATITNLGTIKTTSGDVALIALHVVNGGTILAPDGQALLAGGNEVLYVPDGDSNVVIKPAQTPGGANVDNAGRIAAASAQLKAAGSPYALAVNNTGSVEATGMATVGGRLVLGGGGGDVEAGGTLSAPGGTATLTGGRVAVTGSVDVSAPAGGGSIAVQATNAAAVTPTGSLAANATQQGNGGHISVKSQGATNFAGTASATGGPQGGNGGSAEISGKTLGVTGAVDLKAPKGKAGSLLLDPTDIDVEPGAADPGDIFGGTWDFSQDTTGTQTIGATTIANLLANGNLKLQATNSITVNGAITATSTNTLEFDSPTIAVNQPITITGGTLVFSGINGDQQPSAGQSLTTVASATLAASMIDANSFTTINLGGPVQTTQLAFDNPFLLPSGPASITATNAANVVAALSINDLNLSGALNFSTTGALSVGGQGSAGSMAITAAGDLTMSAQGGVQLAGNNGGPITLASTGGAFINQVGTSLFFPTTGRTVIYSATDSGNFSQGGLGFPQYNPVAFGSDPEPGNVVYIANSTALQSLKIIPDALSRTYGGTGPNFTFNGGNTTLASLAIQPQFALLQGSTPVTNSTGLPAGSYTIVPSGAISANNALSFVNGTFTVNPAPLNIVADNATISFGGAIPTLTASIFGLVNNDPTSVVTGLTVTTTATSSSGVGNYPITPSGASATNYAITFTAGTLTIGKAAVTLTITADDMSRLYGAANPTFTASYSGFVNGDNSSVVSGLVLSTPATSTSPVGTYPIIASGATAANYNIALVNGTLTVTPAPLTITANAATRIYGASDPAFSASYQGFVNGEGPSVVSGLQFGTNETNTSPVGTAYTITPFGGAASNYSISYATGALSITPAPLTITANDASKTYGAANPAFTASYAGFANGETSSVVTGLQFSTAATSASPVGGYAITPSGASASNYTISYAAGTLTVNPAPLTITANDASRLYGASNPAFTASYSGFVNGETSAVVSGLQLATTATAASNAGAYPITPSGASAANYAITYVPGTLTVTPAPLTITADDVSAVYGHSIPAFTASYAGFVNGDTSAVVSGLQFVANGIEGSPVGTYTITPFGASAANYTINFTNGTLSITPAPLTIAANDASRLYGAANPTFTATYTGLVNGDDSSVVSGLQLATSAATASHVGTYAIIPSGAAASNYAISYLNGTLTVTPAPLTITANASKIYGAALPSVLPASDFAGFVNGDTTAVVVGLQLHTTATAGSNVGTYPLTASGAGAQDYSISLVPGTLTVTPAPLQITANNTSRVYGSSDVAFSASYTGLVNGDTSAVVSGLTIGTNAVIGASIGTPPHFLAPVGTYSLVPSGASAANYSISYANGTLEITPAALIVTANNASKTYGSANPAFSASASGFVNGDSPSLLSGVQFFTPATTGSGVGSYVIDPSGGSAGPNYELLYLPGSLTVTPAPLTITANNATRLYGQNNPVFTGTVAGLVNADAPSIVTGLVFATMAGTGANVGTYPIVATQATASAGPNYTLSFVNGRLTITPAPLTITANNVGILVNQPFPTLTGTFSGLIPGEPQPNGGFGFTSTATTSANTGKFPITLTGSNPNYAVTFNPGTLFIAGNSTALTIFTSQFTTQTMTTTQPAITTTTQTLNPTAPLNVNNTAQTITVYGVNDPGLLFGPEADSVLTVAINSGILSPDIYAQLETNPSVAEAAILPLLYSHLSDLLAVDQSLWTPAQTTFVNDVINFINQQKQTAALVAENDYATWWAQQQASETAQMNGLAGPTWIMMSSMLASNPPIPPDSILQEAAAGVAMTGQQAANYTAIQAATTTLAEDMQQGLGTVPGIFAGTLSTLYAARIAYVDTAETGSVAESLFALSPKLANVVFPNIYKSWRALYMASEGISLSNLGSQGFAKAAAAINNADVEKFAADSFKGMSDASKVLQLAGPITEVIADVMQIGVSAAQYANLAAYNASFNAAIAADNTPVTIASLKAMDANNPTQVYDYLTNMLAGGNTVQPITVAPSTPMSVYESPPMPTVSYP